MIDFSFILINYKMNHTKYHRKIFIQLDDFFEVNSLPRKSKRN